MKKVRKQYKARNLISLDAKRRMAGKMRHKNDRRALEKSKRVED